MPNTYRSNSGRRQQGFNLVELMVAMVAGLIVSTAVIAFALSSMKSNGEYVQSTRVTQELRNTMDLVTRELRRAGYDEKALGLLGTGEISSFSRIKLDDAVTSGGNTYYQCVIYSYDRVGGYPGSRDLDRGEVRAIRWVSQTVAGKTVGVMEYAESAGTTAPACDGASPNYTNYPVGCDSDSHWCALSDPRRIDISEFHIADNRAVVGSGTTQVQLRDLALTMKGRNPGTTDTERSVQSDVRVRSDCYDPTISNCSNSPSL